MIFGKWKAYDKYSLWETSIFWHSSFVNVVGKKKPTVFLCLFESTLLLFESMLFLTLLPEILGSIFKVYSSNIGRVQMV